MSDEAFVREYFSFFLKGDNDVKIWNFMLFELDKDEKRRNFPIARA